jgi:serine phosphatase RsbU (regulator of sigma subunit)
MRLNRSSLLSRYGIAVAAPVLTLLIRLLLLPILGDSYPVLLFLPAVMLAGWYGGVGPGLVAVALTTGFAGYFFMPTLRFNGTSNIRDEVGLLLFTLVGLLITYLNHTRRITSLKAEETAASLKESQQKLQEAYEQQKRIAETLQRSLLLTPAQTKFEGLDVEAFYEPARDEFLVGGDFFDAFALANNKVALVVGDVSGKGLQAATHTAEIKFALRTLMREFPNAGTAMIRLNNVVCDSQELDNRSFGRFISMAVAVVDVKTGEGQLSLAGAEPPLLLRRRTAGGVSAIPQTEYDSESLDGVHGLPLCVENKYNYEVRTMQMNLNDTLVMLTDGITEARRGRELFGYDAMSALSREAVQRTSSLHDVGQAILDGARSFANGKLQDDACILLARRVEVA